MDAESTAREERAKDKLHRTEADMKDALKEAEHRVAAAGEKGEAGDRG